MKRLMPSNFYSWNGDIYQKFLIATSVWKSVYRAAFPPGPQIQQNNWKYNMKHVGECENKQNTTSDNNTICFNFTR